MLGKYLKDYRLNHNLTQKEMAEKLQTNQSYYSLLENGKVKPGINTMKKITLLLDMDPAIIRRFLCE